MSYADSIEYLYNLQKYGIKLGLDNIRTLMSLFNNPQKDFLSVHVAGTNGKGSTSAMIASMLQASGLKVGLFTSPHLVSFTERVRINNEKISEQDVVGLTDEIRKAISKTDDFSPTFFEVVTTIGFLYFKRNNIDIAIIETGMGGRLDATNVIKPEVSVITNISYDHKEFLGNALKEIAGEKAGIIKEGIPVVTSRQDKSAMQVLRKKADEQGSEIFEYGKDFSAVLKEEDINGCVFDYQGEAKINNLWMPLIGRHQMFNAASALKAVEILSKRLPDMSGLSPDVMRTGLETVKWPGRLEFVSYNPPILIDGAHNPDASAVLADSLKRLFLKKYNRMILILGVMADKDIEGILSPLLPLASQIICTVPNYSRAESPQRLADRAVSMGYKNIHTAPAVMKAIELAKSKIKDAKSDLILITGSLYTIGEVKEILGEKAVLGSLRETR